MSITRIRGEQIQADTIKAGHIAAKQVANVAIADDAAIAESKLNINWATHYGAALATKLVLDYVQMNNVAAVGGSVENIIAAATPRANDNTTDLGVIVTNIGGADKNKVIIRDKTTGEPILDGLDEIYGRITWDATLNGATGGFKLSFFKGNDSAVNFATSTPVDLQYVRRFNLQDVDEAFSMNEKFVDGVADVTTALNLEQLAKDLYGTATLDRDGVANLAKSVVTQISDEVTARGVAEGILQDNIDDVDGALDQEILDRAAAVKTVSDGLAQELLDRAAAVKTVADNLAQELLDRVAADKVITDTLALTTTATGAGAKGVGVESNANYAGATAQAVLNDLASRTAALETGGGAEVTDTHTREADSANDYFLQKIGGSAFAAIEDRLEEIETIVDAKAKVADDTASEVTTARGSKASLDARLDVAIREDGILVDDAKLHVHKQEVFVIAAPTNKRKVVLTGVVDTVGDQSVLVYINGIYQLNDALSTGNGNYSIDVNKKDIIFSADTDILVAGDVVVVTYVTRNTNIVI